MREKKTHYLLRRQGTSAPEEAREVREVFHHLQ
jgi:hypothetical protein